MKQSFNHLRDISSAPHVDEINPTILSGMALGQHFHWLAAAMVNNHRHAMRVVDQHIHPLTKLWCALAECGPLKGMFPEFFKLAEITMIQLRVIIIIILLFYIYLFIFSIISLIFH